MKRPTRNPRMAEPEILDETTIRVKRGTKEILDFFKVISRESYDNVIIRISQNFLEDQLEINESTQELIEKRMKNLKKGKVLSFKELIKKIRNKKNNADG